MKHKLLNAALIITSLLGYLEWGKGNSAFLLSAETHVLKNIFTDPLLVIHPFTIIPLIGQVMLLIGIFQSRPSKLLTYIGITALSLLLVLVFLIGVRGGNIRMTASASPFIITSAYAIITLRKKNVKEIK